MLTLHQATKLLELLTIPYDIQQKILIFFLSYGTLNSSMIKVNIKEMDVFYKTNPKYIKSFLYPTLWRYYSRGVFPKPFKNQPENYDDRFEYLAELEIAYINYFIGRPCLELKRISQEKIQSLTKIRLIKMINEDE